MNQEEMVPPRDVAGWGKLSVYLYEEMPTETQGPTMMMMMMMSGLNARRGFHFESGRDGMRRGVHAEREEGEGACVSRASVFFPDSSSFKPRRRLWGVDVHMYMRIVIASLKQRPKFTPRLLSPTCAWNLFFCLQVQICSYPCW